MVSPTPRAAVVLGAAAATAVIIGVPLALLAMAAIIAATVVDGWFLRGRPAATRRLPDILPRGHATPYRVTVAHRPGLRVHVKQPMPPEVRAEPSEAGGDLVGFLVAHRRGSHAVPPIVARVHGPLGLTQRDFSIDGDASLVVYPDVVGGRRLSRAAVRERFRTQGRRRRGTLGLGTEFESVREYAPDDDIRLVNWTATQRLGRPMTNQYRVEQDRDVICVLDLGRLMGAPLGAHTRLDAAVDAVTAVAYTADELGDRAGVVAFNTAVVRNLPPRRRGADQVVRAIYDLEPTSAESDYEAAFRVIGQAKRAFVIVFTDLLEDTAAVPLLEAMPIIGRKHSVIVAGSRDADLSSAIAEPPRQEYDVYRAVVAVDALEAKRRVIGRLRHLGVDVIDAAPGLLPEQCVDAYLAAKARARV